jgi:hypothetical protein
MLTAMGQHSWSERTSFRQLAKRSFVLGLLFGGAFSLFCQIQPRLASSSYAVFTGAPQGLDEYVYFALVRAIWRTGNGLTYSYPFAVFWDAPPIMIQLPLSAAALAGRLIGLPWAFEFLRICGTSLTAVALAYIGYALFRSAAWRNRFVLFAAFGGAWFTFLGIAEAIKTAGVWGLTELPIYVERALGPLYWWLPFLAQNVWSPLEAVYHAEVLGAFALLLKGNLRLATGVGLITWFSNPFPASSLYAAAIPWLGIKALRGSDSERRKATTGLVWWLLSAAAGFGYYGIFLKHWPVLEELTRMHRVPLAPPPTSSQLIAWFGPFLPPIIWSCFTKSGHKYVWQKNEWLMVMVIIISQVGFLLQFPFLGVLATQPYHFNRGYLAVALFALLFRWLYCLNPRKLSAWALALLISTSFDQGFFFLSRLVNGTETGYVPQEIAELRETLLGREPNQLFLCHAFPYSVYFAAFTDNIPFDMPETMVVPWTETRCELLATVVKNRDDLSTLGISLAILAHNDEIANLLCQQKGWHIVKTTQNYSVYELEAARRRNIPRLPPPRLTTR